MYFGLICLYKLIPLQFANILCYNFKTHYSFISYSKYPGHMKIFGFEFSINDFKPVCFEIKLYLSCLTYILLKIITILSRILHS